MILTSSIWDEVKTGDFLVDYPWQEHQQRNPCRVEVGTDQILGRVVSVNGAEYCAKARHYFDNRYKLAKTANAKDRWETGS
jgi:hypothetical protein